MSAYAKRRRLNGALRSYTGLHGLVREGFFVRVRGLCAALGVAALAAGCTTSLDGAESALMADCMSDRADITAAADWSDVQPYRVRIVNGDFRPMIMYLEQDRPYILELENADREAHDFWAPTLLKSGVALDSIQIDDKAPAKGCVNGVRIKPGSVVRLRFVPIWEGRYEVRNVHFALMPTVGAHAVVNVVPPRLGETVN